MASDSTQLLEHLHEDVLRELVGLSDYIADDEDTSYELLVMLARNTGNVQLLEKAFAKAKRIEDPRQKSDALLEILDEVELNLSTAPVSNEGEAAVSNEQAPVEQFDAPPDEQHE